MFLSQFKKRKLKKKITICSQLVMKVQIDSGCDDSLFLRLPLNETSAGWKEPSCSG